MKEATDRLYEKVLAEQDGYRQWLLAQPPEEILKNAYEYALREDIIYYLEDSDIGDELAEALLKSPYPVYEVARYYEKMDTDYMNDIGQAVEGRAQESANRKRW